MSALLSMNFVKKRITKPVLLHNSMRRLKMKMKTLRFVRHRTNRRISCRRVVHFSIRYLAEHFPSDRIESFVLCSSSSVAAGVTIVVVTAQI